MMTTKTANPIATKVNTASSRSIQWLLSGFAILISLTFSAAEAETVRLFKDISSQSFWRIIESVSTGTVAFHRERHELNGRSTLWRSTEQATEQIDLSTIETTTEKRVHDMFLSENYLYLRTKDKSLFQMSLDGQQVTEIPTPVEGYNFSSPVFGEEPDIIYFLEEDPNFRNDGIYLFRLDEQTATLSRRGNEISDRLSSRINAAFIDDRIVFNGNNALWSVDTSGLDIRELKNLGDPSSRQTTPVFGKNLIYFAFQQANRTGCDLWRSDGTVDGTIELMSIPGKYFDPCAFDKVVTGEDRLVVAKTYPRRRRSEIWETNGTVDTNRLLASVPISARQEQLDLTKAGNHIWYRRITNTGRSIVYVTDLTFTSSRRVMARPRDLWIGFLPVADHMLIRASNSINSTLFKADADGANLAALLRGIGGIRSSQIGRAGKLTLFPFKPTGEPREFLAAVDLTTKKRTVRLGWPHTNGSSAIQPQIIEGADGSVYFCAMDFTRRVVTRIEENFAYRTADPSIWRTDTTPENTNRIIPIDDSSISRRTCGDFAVGSEKVYYSREESIGAGSPQSELWSANLDGTDQKLFVNANDNDGSFNDSSSPTDIYPLADGGVIYTARSGSRLRRMRKLLRGYSDGRHELLGDRNARITEIVKQTGNRFWVRSADGPVNSNPTWSLWVSDGSQSGTRLVARRMYASNFTEINGDVYFTAEFRQDPDRREGLFKVAAGESRPTFVAKFAMQRALEACCTESVRLSEYISDFWAFDGDIVFSQKPYAGQANDQLRRFDIETGRETVLFNSSRASGSIKSTAIFNGYVYAFKESFVDKATVPDWEIWRSAGSAGDAIKIHQQDGDSARIALMIKSTHGILKATSSAIWFFAGDKRYGNELWQLTP